MAVNSYLRFGLIASVIVVLLSCDSLSSPVDSQLTNQSTANIDYDLIRFNGICDGSAVVQLPNKNLLVAYDEENSLFEFSPDGGEFLREHKYGKSLGSKREVDVEGAAAVEQHAWWIGSHGNNNSGKRVADRQQLFRTNITIDKDRRAHIDVATESYNLLPTLLAQGTAAGLLDKSILNRKPKKGGLNIEGLAVMENGDLLVGLRSPLTAGKSIGNAIVVRIDVSSRQPAAIRFYQLNLANRGVRDIHATDNGFLLIAGERKSEAPFSIYRWAPDSQPVRLLDLPANFNAEAILVIDQHWLVFSDDGSVSRSDNSAADGSRRCDSIRRKSPLAERHPSVFFRALVLNAQSLQ